MEYNWAVRAFLHITLKEPIPAFVVQIGSSHKPENAFYFKMSFFCFSNSVASCQCLAQSLRICSQRRGWQDFTLLYVCSSKPTYPSGCSVTVQDILIFADIWRWYCDTFDYSFFDSCIYVWMFYCFIICVLFCNWKLSCAGFIEKGKAQTSKISSLQMPGNIAFSLHNLGSCWWKQSWRKYGTRSNHPSSALPSLDPPSLGLHSLRLLVWEWKTCFLLRL